MKCISCEVEINPQWKHAVEINVCPFCGKHIMEEHLKNLFASLRETMDNLQSYPDQLNDWMLSNHNYVKTDSPQIGLYMPKEMLRELAKVEDNKDFQKKKDAQKFTVKVQTETGEEEVVSEKIQSEEMTNDFFKRAEVIKKSNDQSPAEKTQHLKKVVQQIKRHGSAGSDAQGASMLLPSDMLESADPEAVSEYQSMMSGGEIMSSLPDGGDDDEIPAVVLNMAHNSGGNNSSSNNARDLLKLQQLQQKVADSRKNFATGAKGSFSR